MDTGETMPAQKHFSTDSNIWHTFGTGHTTLLLLALAKSLTAAPGMQWEPGVEDR